MKCANLPLVGILVEFAFPRIVYSKRVCCSFGGGGVSDRNIIIKHKFEMGFNFKYVADVI